MKVKGVLLAAFCMVPNGPNNRPLRVVGVSCGTMVQPSQEPVKPDALVIGALGVTGMVTAPPPYAPPCCGGA